MLQSNPLLLPSDPLALTPIPSVPPPRVRLISAREARSHSRKIYQRLPEVCLTFSDFNELSTPPTLQGLLYPPPLTGQFSNLLTPSYYLQVTTKQYNNKVERQRETYRLRAKLFNKKVQGHVLGRRPFHALQVY